MAHKTHKRLTPWEATKRMFFVALGALFVAVALNLVIVANGMYDGGIAGISIILSDVTGVGLGVYLFVLHIPFVAIGYRQMGKTFALSTLWGITILSVATHFMHYMDYAIVSDTLLAVIFGGVLMGIGIGVAIRWGGCLDGSEIMAILFNKKVPFTVGEILMFFNMFIFTVGGFVFGLEYALYSVVTYYIGYKTIDVVVEGLDEMREAWIITSADHIEMGEAIMGRLGRGVTYLSAEGGYSGEGKPVIVCYFARLEENKLKAIVDELDPKALIKISHVSELKGGRFQKNNIH